YIHFPVPIHLHPHTVTVHTAIHTLHRDRITRRHNRRYHLRQSVAIRPRPHNRRQRIHRYIHHRRQQHRIPSFDLLVVPQFHFHLQRYLDPDQLLTFTSVPIPRRQLIQPLSQFSKFRTRLKLIPVDRIRIRPHTPC